MADTIGPVGYPPFCVLTNPCMVPGIEQEALTKSHIFLIAKIYSLINHKTPFNFSFNLSTNLYWLSKIHSNFVRSEKIEVTLSIYSALSKITVPLHLSGFVI